MMLVMHSNAENHFELSEAEFLLRIQTIQEIQL